MLQENLLIQPRISYFSISEEKPNLKYLTSNYLHSANVVVTPEGNNFFDQDLNKVISIRPEFISDYISVSKTTRQISKGIFAFGSELDEQILFEIYSGYPRSPNDKQPSNLLQHGVGLFVLELIKNGYQVKPNGVNFAPF